MQKSINFLSLRTSLKLLIATLLACLLTACNPFEHKTDLEIMQKRNTVIMGTINSPLTYSYDGDNYSGLDYELAKKFADYLQLELEVKEFANLDDLFLALENNEIDFAGAGLTLTPKRAEKYRSSPPYYYLTQTLVYRKGAYQPKDLSDISEPISVLKGSSHEEHIYTELKTFPNLIINVLDNEDQASLLQKVAEKEIPYAIVDSTTLAQNQLYYPTLTEAFIIKEKQPVTWLIRKAQDDSLYSAIIEYMGNQYKVGAIAKVEEKYFGHINDFDYVDARIFLKRINSRLPKYRSLFKKYATPEISELLLAAISYQESHWDPDARSATGVRGMMMLTLNTAKFLDVKNRLDPEQSIQGGAKYLTHLLERLPDSIPEDEKIWFALAAYNIGLGHLLDVRRITEMRDQNPDSWAEVKENLPLLHQRKWYTKTRYGYARGLEALHYIDNIRQYLETLTWQIQEQDKKLKLEAELQAEADKQAAIEAQKQAEIDAAQAVIEEAETKRLAAIEQEKQAKLAVEQQAEIVRLADIEEAKKAALAAAQKAEADRVEALKIKLEDDAVEAEKNKLIEQSIKTIEPTTTD